MKNFSRDYMAKQLRRPSGPFGRFWIVPMLRRLNARINGFVLDNCALRPDDVLLEVGFGGGEVIEAALAALPRGRVIGVDFAPDMVKGLAGRLRQEVESGHLELHCAPAEALPLPDASVSKVCATNVLYFWDDPSVALAEFFRVLQPGGRLALAYSTRAFMSGRGLEDRGFTFYEPHEVEALMRAAGFADVQTASGCDERKEYCCTVGVRPER